MPLRLSTTPPESDSPDEHKAELTEHLGELRTRIIRAVLYCAGGMIVMYMAYSPMYHFISSPITNALKDPRFVQHIATNVPGQPPVQFMFSNFTDPFFLTLQISVVGGLILAIPFVAFELWGFVAPGLTRRERRAVRLVAPFSVLLFLAGVACAFAVLPFAIRWFLGYMSAVPGAVLFQNPLVYVVFTCKMMLAFGLVFQLPVVLMFLGKAGIISSTMMKRYWRQITVGLFTTAMVVAPSNDIFTMLALAVPLTLLFIGSIWIVKRVEPKPGDVLEVD